MFLDLEWQTKLEGIAVFLLQLVVHSKFYEYLRYQKSCDDLKKKTQISLNQHSMILLFFLLALSLSRFFFSTINYNKTVFSSVSSIHLIEFVLSTPTCVEYVIGNEIQRTAIILIDQIELSEEIFGWEKRRVIGSAHSSFDFIITFDSMCLHREVWIRNISFCFFLTSRQCRS